MPIEIRSNLSERLGVLIRTQDDLDRSIVDMIGRSIKERAERHTPVKTGKLKRSWKRSVRARVAPGTYTTRIWNLQDYAPFVEWDTRPHRIDAKPGGYLAFTGKGGQTIFRKSVQHPGTQGHHMLGKAVFETSQTLHRQGEEELRRWARSAGF